MDAELRQRLRRVVALEGAVPLLIVDAMAIGVGRVAAARYIRSEVGIRNEVPGAVFWVTVLGGIFAPLAIASTFPILERMTGPDVARNEHDGVCNSLERRVCVPERWRWLDRDSAARLDMVLMPPGSTDRPSGNMI